MRQFVSALVLFVAAGCGATSPTYHPPADLRNGNPGGQDLTMDNTGAEDMSMDNTGAEDLTMDNSGGDMSTCDKPSTLHPPKPGKPSIYCPFSGTPAIYCTAGTQHCCEPTTGAAVCNPIATACGTKDTDWRCEDPVADCAAGQKCCASGAVVQSPDPNCDNYATSLHGTQCAASCGANEIELCTADAECSAGKHCVPFKSKGNSIGGCL